MQIPKRKPAQFSSVQTDPLLTQAAFDALVKKLARLKSDRPHLANEVHRLAQNGDFSENAEYQMAKGRLRGMNDQIDRLEFQINRAVLIEAAPSDRVAVGHRVTLHLENNGEKKYTILGSHETNPTAGIISHESPLGRQLLGRKIGEKISLTRAGSSVVATITKIELA